LAADKALLGHILKHSYFGKEFHLTHTSLILKDSVVINTDGMTRRRQLAPPQVVNAPASSPTA